jgi:D-glycero-alpha-D-manno-heptose-7-phosphate kinase
LKHDLARACLTEFKENGLEISSIADIPGSGTGLGSSSSYTVGLLLALSELHNPHWSPASLAEDAYMIEAGCGKTLGKQDHYAAAFGGFHYYQFCQGGHVCVDPICLDKVRQEYIQEQMLLLWTGKTRQAEKILKTQSLNLTHNYEVVEWAKMMRGYADDLAKEIDNGDLDQIGLYLSRGWTLKKKFVGNISDDWIDDIYWKALGAGAVGGKLCGAGGGGFMLFWVDPDKRKDVIEATGLREVPFLMEEKGSTVIYNSETK